MLRKALSLATSALVLASMPLLSTVSQSQQTGPYDDVVTRYFSDKKKTAQNDCTASGDGCCVSTGSGGTVWVYNCTVTTN